MEKSPCIDAPIQGDFSFTQCLLLLERHAVRALVNRRVHLVRADHDLVQRTVVLRIAVVGTLGNRALNAFVGFGHHGLFLLLF